MENFVPEDQPLNSTNYVVEISSPLQPTLFQAQPIQEIDNDEDDEYFKSFPPGYKFHPDDDELIVFYLEKKILNLELPKNKIIDVKLYEHNPKDLAVKYDHYGTKVKEKKWYFFTPRDRKYKNGSRPNRAAGNGYWKATGADKKVFHKGKLVGYRKSLVFYVGKPPKGNKTNWIMHEFRVANPPTPKPNGIHDMKLDDWVLCSIHEKDERPSSKNRQREGSVGDVNEDLENNNDNNNLPVIPYDDHSSFSDLQNQRLFSYPVRSYHQSSTNVYPFSFNHQSSSPNVYSSLFNHQSSSTHAYPSSFNQVVEDNNNQFGYMNYGYFANYGGNHFTPPISPLISSWKFNPMPETNTFISTFQSHGTGNDDSILNGKFEESEMSPSEKILHQLHQSPTIVDDFQNSVVDNSITQPIFESLDDTPQSPVKTKKTETSPNEKS